LTLFAGSILAVYTGTFNNYTAGTMPSVYIDTFNNYTADSSWNIISAGGI